MPENPFGDEPVPCPIDGVLDLHTFRPQDVKEVLLEYLEQCRARGIWKVRVVHGKGIGALRETVQALLKHHPDVEGYALASAAFGGWGATIVELRPGSGLPNARK